MCSSDTEIQEEQLRGHSTVYTLWIANCWQSMDESRRWTCLLISLQCQDFGRINIQTTFSCSWFVSNSLNQLHWPWVVGSARVLWLGKGRELEMAQLFMDQWGIIYPRNPSKVEWKLAKSACFLQQRTVMSHGFYLSQSPSPGIRMEIPGFSHVS